MKPRPVFPVSVILPVHNAELSLHRAVESITRQTFGDWELILIENGSTDSTPEICRRLEKTDSRIRMLSLPGKGISAALNKGLENARHPLIARMDADDISYPNRLELQARFMAENPEVGLVSGLVDFASNSELSEGYREYVNQINGWISWREIYGYRFVESPFAHPSVMFRKSLIESFGPYSNENIPEDYELWLRWMDRGVKMAKIQETVIRWNDSPARLSRTHKNYRREAFDKVRYAYLANWLKKQDFSEKNLYVWGGGKLAKKKLRLLQSYFPFEPAAVIDVKPKEKLPSGHIHFTEIPPPQNSFIISMVSNRGKFHEIEDFLRERGYLNNQNFIPAG